MYFSTGAFVVICIYESRNDSSFVVCSRCVFIHKEKYINNDKRTLLVPKYIQFKTGTGDSKIIIFK